MNASDNADAADWSYCRCVAVDVALDVDIEVANRDVAVVDAVVVVVVVAYSVGGAKNLRGVGRSVLDFVWRQQ